MDSSSSSWEGQPQASTGSPLVKFEASPAESFMSAPGEMYPSLFGTPTRNASTTTMNPLEILTPQSFSDEKADCAALAALAMPFSEHSESPEPTGEKKPSKKRKSWGQVLPEPKTNLPPRKRAKTADEKEQRRVERVLRNRRAAQSSRERKRMEVESLEHRNKQLETALEHLMKTNQVLLDELHNLQRSTGVVPRSSNVASIMSNPLTFSHPLFASQDANDDTTEASSSSLVNELLLSQPDTTVNPASLSPPALSPVPEERAREAEAATAAPTADASPAAPSASSDLTQHPAEVLCDLQCQSLEVVRRWPSTASQQTLHPALALMMQLNLLLASMDTLRSIFQKPLTLIATSLRAGFSIPPTPLILNTILWAVTRPRTSSTSTSSSTTTSLDTNSPPLSPRDRPSSPAASTRPTLRIKPLRKILTCSPFLARPLMDATMVALRLVTDERRDDRVQGSVAAMKPVSPPGDMAWPSGVPLPSREALLTLLWALKVEERRIEIREQSTVADGTNRPELAGPGFPLVQRPKSSVPSPTDKYITRVTSPKRKREAEQSGMGGRSLKRR